MPVSYEAWYRTTIPAAWTVPRHVRYLCSVVDDLIAGRIQRVAISVPPGHAKSDTITRRLPLYWAERYAGDRIVVTGYNQTFANRQLSGPARDLARERGTLAADATALDEWSFTSGARLIARGVGSAPTGVNPISLLISDDPTKDRAQAASQIERDNMWQWWTGSIVQRFWPRTRALIIATRWHEDDIIGRLMAQEAALPESERTWTFVNLPALSLGADVDPLGRAEGEALWPEAKPADFLHRLRREMGAYDFEALFQGNPTPREGTLFKVGSLRYINPEDVPSLDAVCRAWDLAATDGAGDYTAGVKVGRTKEGRYVVLDVARGQWSAGERNRRMVETAALDGAAVRIRLPQDPGQAGKEQASSMTRMLAGYPITTAPVTGAKEVRAEPFAAQIEAGNVDVVRGSWNAAFVEELRAFPSGANDDAVDAASDAFNGVAAPSRSFTFF